MSSFNIGALASGRRRRAVVSAAAALTAAAALATPAGAAVTGQHVIALLPDSSGAELSAYPPDTTLGVEALRNGVSMAVGSTTTDAAGDAAINGGGAVTDCWTNFTPDLQAGDEIKVTGPNFTDTMIMQGVTSERPVEGATPDTVEVHGTASDPAGNQLPITGVEARLIASSRTPFSNGKRLLRAGVGNPFPLAYDTPTGTAWTATFSGLSPSDVAAALNATDSRGIFSNAALNEQTISQNPLLRGPQPPCTAPVAQDAVTSANHPVVNIANVGSDLVVSGVSQDASAVSVSLDDGDPGTPAVTGTATPAPATGAQTWSVTVPAAAVQNLKDGTLTASGTYTVPATAPGATGTVDITGGTLHIAKDTVAPAAPIAAPAPARFDAPQDVRLDEADTSASIHFTTTGLDPQPGSAIYTGALRITSTQTVKAIAVDPVGNVSPMATFVYTIKPPVVQPPASQPPASGGGGGGAVPGPVTIIREVPVVGPAAQPAAPAGEARALRGTRLVVRRISAARLRLRGLPVTMHLPEGTKVVRIAVFSVRHGRRAARIASVILPAHAGTFRTTLRSRALRRLRPDSYELDATPGRSRSDLRATTRAALKVGR